MKRFPAQSAILVLILCCSLAASADVLKIVVDDAIHPITDELISRAIDTAAQQHDSAILIELSTPGGLLDSTRSIIGKILHSPVPVIIYVAPTGARAASAGFFILESADIAAMAPGTNTGAAHPVLIPPGGSSVKMDDVMKAKVENDSAAFIRSYVGKRGRNVDVAESAVRESKSWSDGEALQQHLIDIVAANEQELLKQLDGRVVTRFDGSKVMLHTANQPVRELPMTVRQRILAFIMDPNIAFILLAIGALALYAEFNHPGAVVPGVVGAIFILLAAFALNLMPVSHAALALIVLAFILFALEAKFATHGALAVGGIASLTLGGLLLVDGPIPEMRVRWWTALSVSIPLGIITSFLMALAIRARRQKSITGPRALIGSLGVTRTPLTPGGTVFVEGELWNAVAPGRMVSVGEQVRIRDVDGLVLSVEPLRAPK
jgi:membrane-bound serine protease (ClpP class)